MDAIKYVNLLRSIENHFYHSFYHSEEPYKNTPLMIASFSCVTSSNIWLSDSLHTFYPQTAAKVGWAWESIVLKLWGSFLRDGTIAGMDACHQHQESTMTDIIMLNADTCNENKSYLTNWLTNHLRLFLSKCFSSDARVAFISSRGWILKILRLIFFSGSL